MTQSTDSPTREQRLDDAAAFRRMAKFAADPELAERLEKFADELEKETK